MSVVIVTGSRDWTDRAAIGRVLTNAIPSLVVQGGARGADRIALEWSKDNGIPSETFHANWRQYGKIAGRVRNCAMLNAFPKARVVAFPLGGPGTRHCIAEAQHRGMEVFIYGLTGELFCP